MPIILQHCGEVSSEDHLLGCMLRSAARTPYRSRRASKACRRHLEGLSPQPQHACPSGATATDVPGAAGHIRRCGSAGSEFTRAETLWPNVDVGSPQKRAAGRVGAAQRFDRVMQGFGSLAGVCLAGAGELGIDRLR